MRKWILTALVLVGVFLAIAPTIAQAQVKSQRVQVQKTDSESIKQKVAERQAEIRAKVAAAMADNEMPVVKSTPIPTSKPTPVPTVAPAPALSDIKATAYKVMSSAPFNWGNHWSALDALVQRESGWNQHARNKSSGACGLPQRLPCRGLDQQSVEVQIDWMCQYIAGRYGNPTNALAAAKRKGWY